jgi:hypothetical protein
MAYSRGKLYAGTALYKHGRGSDTDAALRLSRNVFDLASDSDPAGGTTNGLFLGTIREGCVPRGFRIACTTNLSGINFTIGTIASVAKYAAAAAGPAANAEVAYTMPIAAKSQDPLTAPEDIYAFPSGALQATGTLVTQMEYAHR